MTVYKKSKSLILLTTFLIFTFLVFLLACGCGEGVEETKTEKDFFSGKTITIKVPHGAGGGYDTYARILAPYLAEELSATVVVENVTGGGGIAGRNEIYASEPDGLTLGFSTIAGSFFAEWAEQEGVKHENAKFSWIGRLYFDKAVLCVSPQSELKTIEDVIETGTITLSLSGIGNQDYYVAIMAGDAVGYIVEPISGYEGSHEAIMGTIKGETQAHENSYGSVKPAIDNGDLIPVLVLAFDRLPELPDVPTILEVASEEKLEIVEAMLSVCALDRVLFTPPGVPEDRLQVLRDAMDNIAENPKFVADLKKANRDLEYVDGEGTEQLVEGLSEVQDMIKALVMDIASRATT